MLVLGYVIITFSLFFILSGVMGLFRFPDFYTKIHAAGVLECCGAPMFLVGLSCLQETYINIFKLLLSAALILLLNPISSHALGKAAISIMHKLKDYK